MDVLCVWWERHIALSWVSLPTRWGQSAFEQMTTSGFLVVCGGFPGVVSPIFGCFERRKFDKFGFMIHGSNILKCCPNKRPCPCDTKRSRTYWHGSVSFPQQKHCMCFSSSIMSVMKECSILYMCNLDDGWCGVACRGLPITQPAGGVESYDATEVYYFGRSLCRSKNVKEGFRKPWKWCWFLRFVIS